MVFCAARGDHLPQVMVWDPQWLTVYIHSRVGRCIKGQMNHVIAVQFKMRCICNGPSRGLPDLISSILMFHSVYR